MESIKRIAKKIGLLATLLALLAGVTQIQTANAGNLVCTINHSELEAINHIQLNWFCDQNIGDWVTMAFGDGSQTDVYMEANTGETDHWFGFAPGYETIHTVSLIVGQQRFDYSFSIDDTAPPPPAANCVTTMTPGQAFNEIIFEFECDPSVNEWGTVDFGDQTGTDVFISEGVGNTSHWYEYQVGGVVAYDGSLTVAGETFGFSVGLDNTPEEIFTYLPLVTTPLNLTRSPP